MNTQAEIARIRGLWDAYTSGSEWLENSDALKVLGAEVGTRWTRWTP